VRYSNATKYSKAERASGKRITYVQGDRQSLIKFDYDTRVGEVMHLAAWAFNLPPFIALFWAGELGWMAFIGAILLLDSYLVMLQRYNRIRVRRLIERQDKSRSPSRERVERAQA
jgi:hypothetical protein